MNSIYIISKFFYVLYIMILDAVISLFNRALSLKPHELTTPEHLNKLIEQSRTHSDFPENVQIKSTEIKNIKADSSNCQNSVISLNCSSENNNSSVPDSAFLKIPESDLVTRIFFNFIMSWELECQFYQQIAKDIPIRVPKSYAAVKKNSRFALLLEDLNADESVTLFTNKDMMNGPTINLVRKVLRSFAAVHGEFHGLPEKEQNRLLSPSHHPYTSPIMRALGIPIGNIAIKPCQNKAPDILTEEMVDLYKLSMKHWSKIVNYWYSGPLTLVHGDSHLGNVFVSGDEMGLLDWQAAHWGKGIRDVQYFLINSLPSEVLEEHEQELFQYYLEQLSFNGCPLNPEETWDEYRAYTFQTWKTIIVSLGLGAMTEKEEVMMEILKRCTAAIKRVGYSDWLDNFLKENA